MGDCGKTFALDKNNKERMARLSKAYNEGKAQRDKQKAKKPRKG